MPSPTWCGGSIGRVWRGCGSRLAAGPSWRGATSDRFLGPRILAELEARVRPCLGHTLDAIAARDLARDYRGLAEELRAIPLTAARHPARSFVRTGGIETRAGNVRGDMGR